MCRAESCRIATPSGLFEQVAMLNLSDVYFELGGRTAGENSYLMGEVRLVGESAVGGKFRPIDVPAPLAWCKRQPEYHPQSAAKMPQLLLAQRIGRVHLVEFIRNSLEQILNIVPAAWRSCRVGTGKLEVDSSIRELPYNLKQLALCLAVARRDRIVRVDKPHLACFQVFWDTLHRDPTPSKRFGHEAGGIRSRKWVNDNVAFVRQ